MAYDARSLSPAMMLALRVAVALVWLEQGLWRKVLSVDAGHLRIARNLGPVGPFSPESFLWLIGLGGDRDRGGGVGGLAPPRDVRPSDRGASRHERDRRPLGGRAAGHPLAQPSAPLLHRSHRALRSRAHERQGPPVNEDLWAGGNLGKTGRAPEVVFSQVHEDASVELELLRGPARPGARVFCIASAGDTALALLAARPSPARVEAVDIYPAQLHMVELKAAALARLEGRALLDALEADGSGAYPALRPSLQPAAAAFWDARISRLAEGINNCGLVDRALRRAAAVFRLAAGRRRMEAVLGAATPEEQRRAYERNWDTALWRTAFAWGLSRPALVRPESLSGW